ncbi:hypothetical protein HU200_047695 [Digitaria exilis]|uniref:Uncharacterized protein n=1 Tax=Digitaria exilis TaxID=1010633 RepID=A0A835AWL3_9POAL|nr:hypothetical protein HU200_047695 [Digitaria exilis]
MGYRKPVPMGTDLSIFYLIDMEGVVYPICLWKSYQWETGEVMKEHAMGVATSNLWRKFYRKSGSRHHVVARNEGWMGHRSAPKPN